MVRTSPGSESYYDIHLRSENKRHRSCLASNINIFNFIFTFFKNNQHQNIITFFTFYIISIIFYYYSNKKIHYDTNFFSLFYINYFYFISHLSLFTNSKILFSLFCSVHSLAKHTHHFRGVVLEDKRRHSLSPIDYK